MPDPTVAFVSFVRPVWDMGSFYALRDHLATVTVRKITHTRGHRMTLLTLASVRSRSIMAWFDAFGVGSRVVVVVRRRRIANV